ncbi:hypothetical protein BD289DRAFT_378138 [Coniella lustricola]|uniref:Arrestin C-terminal-like domain-containing protein n=1 Tax=Coniella lustricola TaxID=2025994 RepID=A0A2T2ZUJ9_9PEZI|nr:hypothetical protein BD289DRAFT_378138 [Coniella lustricola]
MTDLDILWPDSPQPQRGIIYYTPPRAADRRLRRSATTATANPSAHPTGRSSLSSRPPRASRAPSLPAPQIGPRYPRPHSIHIVSYPSGFVPPDLRPRTSQEQQKKKNKNKNRNSRHLVDRQPTRSSRTTTTTTSHSTRLPSTRDRSRSLIAPSLPGEKRVTTLLNKFKAAFLPSVSAPELPRPATSPAAPVATATSSADSSSPPPQPRTRTRIRPVSWLSTTPSTQRFSRADCIGVANPSARNSFMSVRSAKNVISSSVHEIPQSKPTASGSGLSCTILLAEPNVFLTGFDHDGHTRQESHNSTALLRGKLQLNVTKNTKIKAVTLKLLGKARTEWPEGIPPTKVDMYEEQSLRTQALTFFHAMHDNWETEFGNQCTYTLKSDPTSGNSHGRPSLGASDSSSSLGAGFGGASGGRLRTNNLSAKELKKLSMRSVESRSFGKTDSPAANPQHAKGFKVFYPGKYEYSFELPIDHHQLETIKLQYGSVKWELETTVERAGAFKPNLHGSKEVSIVRVPDQMSLEMSEPISISRQWEDQLHYDILISGKSFPIGSKIPIAFKLTPLAKVQVHKLKVFVTESIEYWTNDRRVARKDPGRKILLLEKTAGKPLDKQFASSELCIIRGGELSSDERSHARASAARRRTMDAQRTGTIAQPLPEPTDNMLGDLDLGLEAYWASTEMEMNVQMPTCEMMTREKALRLHPDCSWKNVNVYHWMKIVMRISRLDPEDPAGKRRRHFEISIDSPFTVLNCRATQANTALPQYNDPQTMGGGSDSRLQTSCGCPDARILGSSGCGGLNGGGFGTTGSSSGSTPENTSGTSLVDNAALPLPPQAAHVHTATQGINGNSTSTSPAASTTAQEAAARPIHLIRYPSFDPPPFNADNPPPPLPTPPPNYDIVVGTPSVDGLADYFARLSDYEGPPQEELSQATNMVPLPLVGGTYFTGSNGPSDLNLSLQHPQHEANNDDEDNDDGEDTEVESDSDSGDERVPARAVSRVGTVNVVNPRTPGGRLVPSRSFEIARPNTDAAFTLSMSGVVRRGGAAAAGATPAVPAATAVAEGSG